jgi:hypothetical protein
MPVPPVVGVVHSSEPRAVQVRDPESLSEIHSAVHAGVSFYTETKAETNLILAHWQEIMSAANDKAQEILGK